ncbi:MAG: asparagine synthase (glutamine-hydrolyzing) [Proteobacteria bacterium]|nr:asparagine synthase (glutamine-hydrolyzing) [Pseudomonadota bacterium]
MCGIAGIYHLTGSHNSINPGEGIKKMTDALVHRGPDASGYWTDLNAGIALGHRRLSIIDLSSNGAQPMTSSCGRYVIVYNGEIYNFRDIKNELESEKKRFRGYSDTEIILEACAFWGIEIAISKFNGMFAFAIWDKHKRCLNLARDRLGIKPIYWGRIGGNYLFASELKAIKACPGWKPEIDRNALAAFMRYSYVPAPYTIYKGVNKLSPGSILTINQSAEPVVSKYWDMATVARNGINERFDISDYEATIQVENSLNDAVKQRMISDVPLGALLSGGIDSTTVAALMQANSINPIKTFTIGFHARGYDEAKYAKVIANTLGTDHTELYVTHNEARNVIPLLSDIYDEPFADSSQIPTYLVSKLARNDVTVVLSGDGGDEVFAGYNRYLFGKKLIQGMNICPSLIKRMMGNLMLTLSPESWSSINTILPDRLQFPQFGEKIYKLAELLSIKPEMAYQSFVSKWNEPESLVTDSIESKSIVTQGENVVDIDKVIERMQFLDTISYLPDDILTKVDRASMAVSLEARVPLLDHRVVELAWQLPMRFKIFNGKGKWILRNILYKTVPKDLLERPKMGFGVPIGEWLRGPLLEWAETLLDEKKINEQGLLKYELIHNKWQEHLTGKRNWQHQLWNVLMFQAWYERWIN